MVAGRAVFNGIEKDFHASGRHFLRGLNHRGKLGHQVFADGQTVQSQHRHVLRNPLARVPQSTDGTDGHHIRAGKQGGKLPSCAQQRLGRPVAVPVGIAHALVVPLRVKVQAVGPDGL